MRWDWDDARIFVAVATAGSTSAAARKLGLAQTTCARRIEALEGALGVRLFDRSATRFVLNEDGRLLLSAAQEMERGAETLETLAHRARRGAHVVLRLSAADIVADEVVRPALDRFRHGWPDVRIELAVEGRHADVGAGEADIALRAGLAPTDTRLVARQLATDQLAVYCTEEYAARHGMPQNLAEFVERPFAVLAGLIADRLAARFPGAAPRLAATSVRSLADAAASGDLAAILPRLVADRLDGLLRCFILDIDVGGVWLIYHQSLRRQPYVRDLLAAISDSFDAWARPRPVGKCD